MWPRNMGEPIMHDLTWCRKAVIGCTHVIWIGTSIVFPRGMVWPRLNDLTLRGGCHLMYLWDMGRPTNSISIGYGWVQIPPIHGMWVGLAFGSTVYRWANISGPCTVWQGCHLMYLNGISQPILCIPEEDGWAQIESIHALWVGLRVYPWYMGEPIFPDLALYGRAFI